MSTVSITLALVVLLIPLLEAVDLTVEPGATGTEVVHATISKLESAQIFGSDRRLLRRIAYVETEDGLNPPLVPPEEGSGSEQSSLALSPAESRATRDTSLNYGGIWKVDRSVFQSTITDEFLAEKRAEIAGAFPEVGEWEEVVWEDLNRPLWSALAARLLLLLAENSTEIPSASDVTGQAVFWRDFYNSERDTSEFERRVSSLIEEESK